MPVRAFEPHYRRIISDIRDRITSGVECCKEAERLLSIQLHPDWRQPEGDSP